MPWSGKLVVKRTRSIR